MPKFDYKCNQCHTIQEIYCANNVGNITCNCGGKLEKQFPTKVAIVGPQYSRGLERSFYKIYDDDSEPDWGLLEDAKKKKVE